MGFKHLKTLLSCILCIAQCIIFIGCNNKPDLSDIEVRTVTIHRFDSVVKTLDTVDFKNSLTSCCDGFGIFIDGDLNDTNYIQTMKRFITDTLNQRFMYDVSRRFKSLKITEQEMETMFRYMKYYFPDFTQPAVYSYISGGAINTPILYNGTSLVMSLDCFLSSDYYMYKKMGIPEYIAYKLNPENIVKRSAEAIITSFMEPVSNSATVLDMILYHGKILYITHLVIPNATEACIMDYTDSQNKWCEINEGQIWSGMVQGNILFDKNYKVIRDYVLEAPFTKGFTQESPGRVGQWVGLQIIDKYMKNSGCTVEELIKEQDASRILSISKYKPKI